MSQLKREFHSASCCTAHLSHLLQTRAQQLPHKRFRILIWSCAPVLDITSGIQRREDCGRKRAIKAVALHEASAGKKILQEKEAGAHLFVLLCFCKVDSPKSHTIPARRTLFNSFGGAKQPNQLGCLPAHSLQNYTTITTLPHYHGYFHKWLQSSAFVGWLHLSRSTSSEQKHPEWSSKSKSNWRMNEWLENPRKDWLSWQPNSAFFAFAT